MEFWYWIFGLAALGLGVYLTLALFKPEMFS
jgi:K+-transporting ATPase KdpF subunit